MSNPTIRYPGYSINIFFSDTIYYYFKRWTDYLDYYHIFMYLHY